MKKRFNKKEYLPKDIQKEEDIYKNLDDEKYLEFIENKKVIKRGE